MRGVDVDSDRELAGPGVEVRGHRAEGFAEDDVRTAVEEADRPMRDNARVATIGSFCEQPPLGLIKTLEMAGCYIEIGRAHV